MMKLAAVSKVDKVPVHVEAVPEEPVRAEQGWFGSKFLDLLRISLLTLSRSRAEIQLE